MGVKCILLYKLPKGLGPVREDVDRLVKALTTQLYCVPESSGRSSSSSSSRDAYAAGDKAFEAAITIFKQQQAADASRIQNAKVLEDVWLFKLMREAPSKAYVLSKQADSAMPFRVTEADPSIRTFLEKRLEYKQRGGFFVQSQTWYMGDKSSDVTVKLLQVSQQGIQAPKLLALEVAYHPACTLDQAAPLLRELADKIITTVGPPQGQGPGQAGTLVLLQPKFYKPKSNDPNEPGVLFGPSHMVELYTELLQEGLAGRQ